MSYLEPEPEARFPAEYCRTGFYEKCIGLGESKYFGHISNAVLGLLNACAYGYIHIVNLIITTRKISNLFIGKAIHVAAVSCNVEIIELFEENRIWNWEIALKGACEGGHIDLMKNIINKGANQCGHCSMYHYISKGTIQNYHRKKISLAKYFIGSSQLKSKHFCSKYIINDILLIN